ncbi:hypothetical protein E2562_012535 [Oryza meyeriana var. granulata]|uniref:Uncharacterized protein n=1 Tax=Oryza meyeriana var. granulata TaxID=110450 RepID=A0A6G1D2Q1_9ORYZ|nr:hypothetical protein E2562_012535 [Oryza meyeriana var. granulata]
MASARPYRFPVPAEGEPTRLSAAQSCGTCGASAAASCVALCCCPCAVVGCLTLALVKAPYVAGRRCVVRLASKRRRMVSPGATPRKTNRVWDLDDDLQEWRPGGGEAQAESKERLEPGRTGASAPAANAGGAISAVGEGSGRVRSRVDAAEKTWVEIYQLGHWGFGRLSFSQPQVIRGDADNDGVAAARQ